MLTGRMLRYVRQTQFQNVAYFWKGEVILGRTANGATQMRYKRVNNFEVTRVMRV